MNFTNIGFEPVVIDFSLQLVATLIGAFAGFGLVIAWERKKKNEDLKHVKKHTIEAIIEELKSIEKMVKEGVPHFRWNQLKHDFEGKYILVSTPAYDSAIHSGNFNLLPTKLQSEIGYVYLTIEDCKKFSDQTMTYYSTTVYMSTHPEIEASKLCNGFNDSMKKLKEDLKDIMPKLESAL